MNVLYVASSLPWRPDDGERVRSHHLLRELSARARVTVACPTPVPDVPLPDALGGVAWRFFAPDGADRRTRAGCALTLTPVFFRALRSTRLAHWLDAQPPGRWDAIHLDGLPALHYLASAHRVAPRVVFDLRDSWSMLYTRLIAGRLDPSRRLRRWCVSRLERRVIRGAGTVTVVSPVDRDHLLARYGHGAVDLHVVPNGVDAALMALPAFPARAQASAPLVVFTGAMHYPPNDEAARWFVREVLPALRSRRPGLRFAIVGRGPGEAVRALAGEGVEVTGEVESVADWLARADVVVAPLRTGAGIKNKVLEALAAGRPTVASPVAVEGIDVMHDRDLLVADAAGDWVDAITALLDDPARSAALARSGRARMAQAYGWGEAASRYLELYRGRAR